MERENFINNTYLKNLLREGAKTGNKSFLEKALSGRVDLNVSLNQAITFDFLGKHIWNRDALGYRAIHWAARYGRVDIVEWLIQNGSNINQKNDVGNTALHVAIYYNQYQTAAKLLELGANPNAVNNTNIFYKVKAETPLHYAAHYSSEGIVKLLRDFGGDLSKRDSSNKTPLDYAKEKNNTKLIVSLTQPFPKHDQMLTNISETKRNEISENELLQVGRNHLKKLEFNEAMSCFESLICRNSNDVKALIGKGNVFRAQLNSLKAINCYDNALALSTQEEEALFNKAMILIEICKYPKAITIIQQLIDQKRIDGINSYKDLARYMQQHYNYLPPNIDLADIARVINQDKLHNNDMQSERLVVVETSVDIPPPPLPPPLPPLSGPKKERVSNHSLKKIKKEPYEKQINIIDILNAEMKKRFAKMNPDINNNERSKQPAEKNLECKEGDNEKAIFSTFNY